MAPLPSIRAASATPSRRTAAVRVLVTERSPLDPLLLAEPVAVMFQLGSYASPSSPPLNPSSHGGMLSPSSWDGGTRELVPLPGGGWKWSSPKGEWGYQHARTGDGVESYRSADGSYGSEISYVFVLIIPDSGLPNGTLAVRGRYATSLDANGQPTWRGWSPTVPFTVNSQPLPPSIGDIGKGGAR